MAHLKATYKKIISWNSFLNNRTIKKYNIPIHWHWTGNGVEYATTLGNSTTSYYIGQSNFNFPVNTYFKYVRATLGHFGTPPPGTTIYCQVRLVDGDNLSDLVAESVGIVYKVSYVTTAMTFKFAAEVMLAANTNYAICLTLKEVINSTNYIRFYRIGRPSESPYFYREWGENLANSSKNSTYNSSFRIWGRQ